MSEQHFLKSLKSVGFVENPDNKNEFLFDSEFWGKRATIPRCKVARAVIMAKVLSKVTETPLPKKTPQKNEPHKNDEDDEEIKAWRSEMEKKHQAHIANDKLQQDLDKKKKAFEAEERRKTKITTNVAKTAVVVMNRQRKNLPK